MANKEYERAAARFKMNFCDRAGQYFVEFIA
jgi:hypothetical protein